MNMILSLSPDSCHLWNNNSSST